MRVELETKRWESLTQQCIRTVIGPEKVLDLGLETADKHEHET